VVGGDVVKSAGEVTASVSHSEADTVAGLGSGSDLDEVGFRWVCI